MRHPFLRRLPAAALAAVLAVLVLPPAAATALPDDTRVTFTGHGWGHGRGLGQYGSLGYAVDHGWGWERILGHYYGGTSLRGGAANEVVGVRLEGWRGRPLLAASPDGGVVVSSGSGTVVDGVAAVQVSRVGANSFQVFHAPGCAGPWYAHGAPVAGPLTVGVPHDGTYTAMIGVCESGRTRAYRGHLAVVDDGGVQQAVNRANLEDYLRGVVPRESPASWGGLGAADPDPRYAGLRRGMHALRAQSVAARSYALGENRTSYAKTCDTTSCQVYLGAATRAFTGAVTPLEDPRTDRAVADTAGHVMRHADGRTARTEFSSSTGGHTAGGVFPAVVDEGDAVASNPNHTWTHSTTEGEVARLLGVPDVQALSVTERNGLGADGGRVRRLVVDTGSGTVAFTGDQVRSRLGLKSDWFVVSGLADPRDQRFVEALYLDLLSRAGDAPGVQHWTNLVSSGRMSRTDVALYMARSTEWVGRIVDQLYADTLGRPADADGRRFWVERIQGGQRVSDVAAQFYASQEYYQRAGSDDAAWVRDLYRKILQRAADDGEVRFWVDHARARGRAFVAANLYQSLESRYTRIERLYRHLLGRSADQGGKDTWAELLLRNDDVLLAATLAGSQEYYLRAQGR